MELENNIKNLEKKYQLENFQALLEFTIDVARKKGLARGKLIYEQLQKDVLKWVLLSDRKTNPLLLTSQMISKLRSDLLVLASNPYYSIYASSSTYNLESIAQRIAIVLSIENPTSFDEEVFLNEIADLICETSKCWHVLDNIDKIKSGISLVPDDDKYGYLNVEFVYIQELQKTYDEELAQNKRLRSELATLEKIYSEHIKTHNSLVQLQKEKEAFNFKLENFIEKHYEITSIDESEHFLCISIPEIVALRKFLVHNYLIDENVSVSIMWSSFTLVNIAVSIDVSLKNAQWKSEDFGLLAYLFKNKYYNEDNFQSLNFEDWFVSVFHIYKSNGKVFTARTIKRYIRPYNDSKEANFHDAIRAFFNLTS